MVAAGYCMYGSSTILVLTTGPSQLHGYTLDPNLGEFVLTHPNVRTGHVVSFGMIHATTIP